MCSPVSLSILPSVQPSAVRRHFFAFIIDLFFVLFFPYINSCSFVSRYDDGWRYTASSDTCFGNQRQACRDFITVGALCIDSFLLFAVFICWHLMNFKRNILFLDRAESLIHFHRIFQSDDVRKDWASWLRCAQLRSSIKTSLLRLQSRVSKISLSILVTINYLSFNTPISPFSA